MANKGGETTGCLTSEDAGCDGRDEERDEALTSCSRADDCYDDCCCSQTTRCCSSISSLCPDIAMHRLHPSHVLPVLDAERRSLSLAERERKVCEGCRQRRANERRHDRSGGGLLLMLGESGLSNNAARHTRNVNVCEREKEKERRAAIYGRRNFSDTADKSQTSRRQTDRLRETVFSYAHSHLSCGQVGRQAEADRE